MAKIRISKINNNSNFGKGGLVPGYIKGQIFDTDIPAIPTIRAAKQKGAITKSSTRIPSFKRQFGGQGLVNLSGYTPGTSTFNNPVNIIPSGDITMENTPFPVMGIPDKGTKKLMQPGNHYNFPGAKYVTELPMMAQDGGKPTQQDSLDLYNNAIQVLDYYNSKKYTKYIDPIAVGPLIKGNDIRAIEDIQDQLKHDIYPRTNRNSEDTNFKFSDFYQPIDENKYKIRENANAILDLRSPMQLKDWRISPNTFLGFINTDKNDILNGDAVGINTYDPIKIKPYSMLTTEEKAIRDAGGGTFSKPTYPKSLNTTWLTPATSINKSRKSVSKTPPYKFQPIPGNPEQSSRSEDAPIDTKEHSKMPVQYFNNGVQMGEKRYPDYQEEFPTNPTPISKFQNKKYGGKIKRT